MDVLLFKVIEISNDSSVAQGLAFSVVSVTEIFHPNTLEGLKVLFSDGKNLFVENPVNDISARRISQRTLVVIELALVVLSTSLGDFQGVEELNEIDLFDWAKVHGS